MKGAALLEYVANMSALLATDPRRYRSAVARQVQAAILPRLVGTCAELEAPLWRLIHLCLNGTDSSTPAMDERALEAVSARLASGTPPICFPESARASWDAFTALRAGGIFPPRG
jgi:hypothetical protein